MAVQLIETTQRIRKFLHGVRDAPEDVVRIASFLDRIRGIFDHVKNLVEQQFSDLRLPGSPIYILAALEKYEKTLKTLESFLFKTKRPFGREHRVQNTWASMNFASRRGTIQELQNQIRDAIMDLQLAILGNMWELQYYSSSFDRIKPTDTLQDAPD